MVAAEDNALAEIIAQNSVDRLEGDYDKKFQTNYDANNATIDCPMHIDLATDETVEALMSYSSKLGTNALETEEGSSSDAYLWHGLVPIMQTFGVPLCGDGNPTWAINKIMRQKYETYHDKVKGFFGGFHLLLEAHKKRGDLFGPTHMADIFGAFRLTEKQLQWVLHPGDPNQIDSELIMVHLAMHVAAKRAKVNEESQSLGQTVERQKISVSPVDLVDFMLKRAKEKPIAMCILIEIRFAEIIFMLHESEKKSKHHLFIAALKMLLPLFTITHATKYVSMTADFLVDWFCCSDAEKIIFSNAIFTRKTKNGSNIFADRYFEWMVKDLRMWLGKYSTLHHETLIKQVAATLNERKKAKAEGAKVEKNKTDENGIKQLPLDQSFFEVLLYCDETNLWGPGPIKPCKPGPYSKRQRQRASAGGVTSHGDETNDDLNIVDDEHSFLSLSGKVLNKDVLFSLSTGEERARDYFDHFLKDGDWFDPSRSETKGVPLSKINPEIADVEESFMKKEMSRIEIVEFKKLDASYTKDELKRELKCLNDSLMEHGHNKVTKNRDQYKSWSKGAFITCVIEARLKLFQDVPRFLFERKRKLVDEFNLQRAQKNRQFQARINNELQNEIFSLRKTHGRSIYKNEKYLFDCTHQSSSSLSLNNDEQNLNSETGTTSNTVNVVLSPLTVNNRTDMEYSFSPF